MVGLKKELITSYQTDQPVRLNKFLSDSGYCSRRQADDFIKAGRIKVDGVTAELGTKVFPGQTVTADGTVLNRKKNIILIAYHKPAGVECTADPGNPDNIIKRIGYPERIYTIGRLDKASTGLILLTNTGELVNAIAKSINEHEKEYIVTVDQPLSQEFLEEMQKGLFLPELNVRTKPCRIRQTGQDTFHIILTQGLNRQIRRMCGVLGYKVKRLHRIRIMNIRLNDLEEDRYRHVSEEELKKLLKDLSLLDQ